jgi:4-hydroxy-tetrahydrodipicolinate synthase
MLGTLSGSVIIAQTPFDDRGAVDLASIDTLTDFYLNHGADGFVVLGVSGEGPRLAPQEALDVVSRFIARAGGKPVIVGVSNPSSAQLQMLAAEAMDRGASGVMIAPAAGIRTEEELFGYFSTIFDMIGNVPVVLQDFPQSTGVWMSVPSILRLIEAFAQIQVVKEEDLPSLEKISQLRAKQGRRVAIMTGNNGLYLPYEMARGINGPMAGFSHPEMLSGCIACSSGAKRRRRMICSIVICRCSTMRRRAFGASRRARKFFAAAAPSATRRCGARARR